MITEEGRSLLRKCDKDSLTSYIFVLERNFLSAGLEIRRVLISPSLRGIKELLSRDYKDIYSFLIEEKDINRNENFKIDTSFLDTAVNYFEKSHNDLALRYIDSVGEEEARRKK